MRLTKEKVEMFRKFSVCGGITTVEITIKPKKGSDLKDIRVYEFIPKECVDDLNKYLVGQIEGDVYIKSDPLIMWHFDELKKEEKVSYKLSKELGEDCMQAILGLGVSQIKQFCRNSQATGYCQPSSASGSVASSYMKIVDTAIKSVATLWLPSIIQFVHFLPFLSTFTSQLAIEPQKRKG